MNKSIGQTIKERRRKLGINQQTLALLADVGINTIVAVERETYSVSLGTLKKITDALGLEMQLQVKDIVNKGA